MGGQHHAPAALPPGNTRYPGRSGRVRKISPPPGFDPRTVQPVAIPTEVPGPSRGIKGSRNGGKMNSTVTPLSADFNSSSVCFQFWLKWRGKFTSINLWPAPQLADWNVLAVRLVMLYIIYVLGFWLGPFNKGTELGSCICRRQWSSLFGCLNLIYIA
jgi:hypothetical protein